MRRDLRVAIVPWLVARFVVGGGLAVARFVDSELGRGPRPVPLRQGLFAWDAAFYRDIALHGYDSLPRGSLRFFPLYPLVGRFFGWVLVGHAAVGLIVVANLSALAFGALLHRLADHETRRRRARPPGRLVRGDLPGRRGPGDGLRRGAGHGARRGRVPRPADAPVGGRGRARAAGRPVPPARRRPRRAGGDRGVERLGRRGGRRAAAEGRRRARPGRRARHLPRLRGVRPRRLLPAAHGAEPQDAARWLRRPGDAASSHAFEHLFNGDRFGSGLHGVWALRVPGAAGRADPAVPGVVLRVRRASSSC